MTNKESLKALVHLARVCKEECPEIIARNFRGFSDKGAYTFISAAINTVEEMLNEDDAEPTPAEDKDKWIIDETPEYNGCGYAYYICPKCRSKQTRYTPHCPICGKGLSS